MVILRREIYITAALLGAATFVALGALGTPREVRWGRGSARRSCCARRGLGATLIPQMAVALETGSAHVAVACQSRGRAAALASSGAEPPRPWIGSGACGG